MRSPARPASRVDAGRRGLLRMLGSAFLVPLPVLRSLLDPLRAEPSAIAELTPLQLIGWQSPRLREGRWNDAKLLREATESLDEMSHAARADGVNVWARSGHRTLSQQRYLWNSKFRGRDSVRAPDGSRETLDRELPAAEKVQRILSYTAFPGTSRHHWGTDVDMAQSFSDHCADYLLELGEVREGGEVREVREEREVRGEGGEGGEGEVGEEGEEAGEDPPADLPESCLPSHRWLIAHAAEYGWYRVYDAARGGFQPEPWHWSYLPLAVPALARYLVEVTAELLRDRDVDGDSVVLDDFVSYRDRFLLGIAPEALPGPEEPEGEGEPAPEDESGESPTVPELP
ncbi:MAG: D-alanyl-D-alanine carboxypeptidase family protein [Deltaproteobacteria bacterium]|nr:D-alanyl-D-alanine carboxypeptidase family protein [Deltaproteobacteria bacterium]